MPWTPEDSSKHSKNANTPKLKKQWSAVANSVRDKCMADGGNDKECSAKAIMQANGVISKMMEDSQHSFFYLSDISNVPIEDSSDGKKSSWIEMFRVGKWNHPQHGVIEGNTNLFNDFISNWKSNVLGREIALDKTHDPSEGATGWVKDMKIVGDRLKALVEWTPWGLDLIQNKGFKYFSPEYRDSFTDKESGKVYKNVLFGGGITNRPFLTNLSPIVLSEDVEKDLVSLCSPVSMDSNMYEMDLDSPYMNILRELLHGGYIETSELKDFVDEHLKKVDFSNLNSPSDMMMSEELNKEFLLCLEEYFNRSV